LNGKRAKITATATVLGLAGLAGVAIESNHGLPVEAAGVGSNGIVTHASGATTAASSRAGSAGQAPIVTRASGGASSSLTPVDD
jgi:hypothetical protein